MSSTASAARLAIFLDQGAGAGVRYNPVDRISSDMSGGMVNLVMK